MDGWFSIIRSLSEHDIQSVSPSNVSDYDIKAIAELEQDMWAREEWLWLFLKCEDCWASFSKEDIYWWLDDKIAKFTIAKIQRILWNSKIRCKCCWWETMESYNVDKQIEDVRFRFSKTVDSYLTLYRDREEWEIRWFFYWYIDSFNTIYREFTQFHDFYPEASWMKKAIEKNTWISLPDDLFVCSALWMESWYKSFPILYNIMYNFFSSINQRRWANVFGIAESTIWSNTHWIYHSVWAKPCWVRIKKKFESDIFIQPWIVWDYVEKFRLPPREYLRTYWWKMREVMSNN